MTQLQKALALCKEAHKGQFRSDGVTPYETHPIAVAELVSTEEEKIVALLHDVFEDTGITGDVLLDMFGDRVYAQVVRLTKTKGHKYIDYIYSIKECPACINVKIADMFHNLT